MSAFEFLSRRVVGTVNGRPVMSRRNYRGFLIALIAGKRTVVLNADITGSLRVSSHGVGLIANNSFRG